MYRLSSDWLFLLRYVGEDLCDILQDNLSEVKTTSIKMEVYREQSMCLYEYFVVNGS